MNALASFFRPTYDEILAGLRMQLVPVEQPRDDAGRFVSKRELMRKQMADACSQLTPEQRAAAKIRALSRASTPLTDKQREQGRA